MDPRVERGNLLVLQALQASIGLISHDMLGVAVEREPDRVVLHFCLAERSETVDEDIDQMVFELDALLGGKVKIEALPYLGTTDSAWPGRRGRLLWLAKVR
jgi:hypothetical protein